MLLADRETSTSSSSTTGSSPTRPACSLGFVDAHREAAPSRGDVFAPVPTPLVAYRGRRARRSASLVARPRQVVDAGAATLFWTIDGLRRCPTCSRWCSASPVSRARRSSPQRLHGATDGNPLFVLETIRHLFERQLLSLDPSAAGDAVRRRHHATTPSCRCPPLARETLLARVHALGRRRGSPAARRRACRRQLRPGAARRHRRRSTRRASRRGARAGRGAARSCARRRRLVSLRPRPRIDQCVAESLSPARRAPACTAAWRATWPPPAARRRASPVTSSSPALPRERGAVVRAAPAPRRRAYSTSQSSARRTTRARCQRSASTPAEALHARDRRAAAAAPPAPHRGRSSSRS